MWSKDQVIWNDILIILSSIYIFLGCDINILHVRLFPTPVWLALVEHKRWNVEVHYYYIQSYLWSKWCDSCWLQQSNPTQGNVNLYYPSLEPTKHITQVYHRIWNDYHLHVFYEFIRKKPTFFKSSMSITFIKFKCDI